MDEKITKMISDRYRLNKEIMERINNLIERYPEQRFGQIIANYVFPYYREKDFFYEESAQTLVKIPV